MAALTNSTVAPLRVRSASAPTGRKVRARPASAWARAVCFTYSPVLTRAAPRAAAFAQTQAVSIRAALPKVAESARLALAGAAAVIVLAVAQPAMANSCGSMPTGAWPRPCVLRHPDLMR
jgi:hypothetical protein